MRIRNVLLSLSLLCTAIYITPAGAKEKWPREIKLKENGVVTLYQPQPEKYAGNTIDGRTVVSVKKTKGAEPIFGVVWFKAITQTDREKRTVALEDLVITRSKFPDVTDTTQISKLTKLLEEEIPKWDLEVSMEDLLSAIQLEQGSQSTDLNTDPPEIIYQKVNSLLVFIDGEPIVKEDDKMKMERVLNTPFLIIKSPEDKKFYLYSGEYWYRSGSVTSGWDHTTKLPKSIASFDEQIKKQDKEKEKKQEDKKDADKKKSKKPPVIVVRTKPAELIQTDGEPDFKSVPSTTLLYVANTPNNIVKDINTQKVFLLLSGRWYTAATLDGPWTYVPSDKLPADFAKIPEGSAMDAVLSSVAGTEAAKEAAMDAQIPQTAKVDRKNASTKISYDGEPKFTPIKGTSLYVAENASGTVLRSGNKYYAVDNGVWFESDNPTGPWAVATERPEDVEKIPADNSAYNTKYVYIYDNTPDYVYMGYTPGYTGCYLYGPTVVYGTGYHYAPWYGAVYYPRPVTWGFSMHYNPWTGWSFGIGFSTGAFSMTFGFGGGWYGPPMYRPPYVNPYYRGGYYGGYPGGGYGNRYNNINIDNDINIDRGDRNNIYNGRDHVSTRPSRGDGNRGDGRPGGGAGTAGNRPGGGNGASQLPAGGNRPGGGGTGASQLPAGGNRPGGGGTGASQLPAGGNRPGGGGTGASQLPAGGNSRPGTGGAGASQLPAGGNSAGNRPSQTPAGGAGASQLPAGGNRPAAGGAGASQLPAGGNRPAQPSQQPNNMISDKSGNVYKQDNAGNWSQRQNGNWQNADRQQVQNSQAQRDRANQRSNNFQNHGGGGSYRGGGGGGGYRGGGGGGYRGGGGGGRGGGRR